MNFQNTSTTSFGQGPVTQEDLEFYQNGVGDDEAPARRFKTPAAYSHWLDIQRRIVNRLSTKDFSQFLASIELSKKTSKGTTAADEDSLKAFATQILNCSETQQKKLAAAKLTSTLQSGTRVRVVDTDEKGVIGFAMAGGMKYLVTLDKDKDNKGIRNLQPCKIEKFVTLCGVCDVDGTHRCGKCKVAVYCGRDCQRRGWAKHKKVCGKKDENSFCCL